MARSPKISRDRLDRAMQEARKRFGHRDNLTGIDIGYRWTEGKPTKTLAVRLHVKRKLPESELESSLVFPEELDGVPLDVIEGDYRLPEAAPLPTQRYRARLPYVMGGVSISRMENGAGTGGLLVIDKSTGRPGVLSNWHVLAGPHARTGDPVLHPGALDGGVPVRDEIGHLDRWILSDRGDAAVAFLDESRAWIPLQLGTFREVSNVRRSTLGEVLTKSGRSTGLTTGRVDGEGFYRLRYEVSPGVFEDRDITGFKLVPEEHGNPDDVEVSMGGDSGSAWVDGESNTVVGLHFAGETSSAPGAEHAIACNMDSVLEALDIRPATFSDVLARTQEIGSEFTPNPLDPPIYPVPPQWPSPPCWPGWPPGPRPFPSPYPDPWDPYRGSYDELWTRLTGAEYTPRSDDPHTPPWWLLPRPWPWPRPWPPRPRGPWPGPRPGPWDRFRASPGTSALEGTVADEEARLARIWSIWDEVRDALTAYGFSVANLKVSSPLNAVSPNGGNVDAAIARALREWPAFEHIRPLETYHFQRYVTYGVLCEAIEHKERTGAWL